MVNNPTTTKAILNKKFKEENQANVDFMKGYKTTDAKMNIAIRIITETGPSTPFLSM